VPAEIGAALAVETAQAMANPSAQPRLSATANALRGFMIVSQSRINEVGLSAY
jgi:hypothetical protein